MGNKKANISATIDEEIQQEIIILALPENEDRSFSKMLEVLLKEALSARNKIKKK